MSFGTETACEQNHSSWPLFAIAVQSQTDRWPHASKVSPHSSISIYASKLHRWHSINDLHGSGLTKEDSKPCSSLQPINTVTDTSVQISIWYHQSHCINHQAPHALFRLGFTGVRAWKKTTFRLLYFDCRQKIIRINVSPRSDCLLSWSQPSGRSLSYWEL